MAETQNDRKRKRLEDDYDTYSNDLILHTLDGRISIDDAKALHDRAITLIDIAKIYWGNDQFSKARVCISSAINDIKKAIDVLKQLNDAKANNSMKNYRNLLTVFRANEVKVDNLLNPTSAPSSPLINRYDDSDKTPQTPPRHNRTLKYPKSITPDSVRRHTRRNCGLFGCESGSESDSHEPSRNKKPDLQHKPNITGTSLFKI